MSAEPAQSNCGSDPPAQPSGPAQSNSAAAGQYDKPNLIDAVIAATDSAGGRGHGKPPVALDMSGGEDEDDRRPSSRLQRFLEEESAWKTLCLWLGWSEKSKPPIGKEQVARILSRDVALLDELITTQVNAILHHPRFQKLEASWRGLRYLVQQSDEAENVKVRVLNVSWRELVRDVDQAIQFDQSRFFRKVYEDEFGMPGGEPFGLLLGDYEIRPGPCKEHPTDDVEALTRISGVAAAAFAPFIAAVHPSMFGLDDFSTLGQPLNLSATFEQLEYLKWRAFRDTDDARYVGLTLPRVLMRLPYDDDGSRTDGFIYREDVAGPDRSRYLWGNAALRSRRRRPSAYHPKTPADKVTSTRIGVTLLCAESSWPWASNITPAYATVHSSRGTQTSVSVTKHFPLAKFWAPALVREDTCGHAVRTYLSRSFRVARVVSPQVEGPARDLSCRRRLHHQRVCWLQILVCS